jgi:hypothetical protein
VALDVLRELARRGVAALARFLGSSAEPVGAGGLG